MEKISDESSGDNNVHCKIHIILGRSMQIQLIQYVALKTKPTDIISC